MTVSLYEIRLLYIRELRAALRERGLVINSLLVPLLLYPALLWLAFSALGFVQGREERLVSRLALEGLPAAHDALQADLREHERLELLASGDTSREALESGALDLLVRFDPPSAESAGPEHNFAVSLWWNSAEDRSVTARRRFEKALADYRAEWIRSSADRAGIDAGRWRGFDTELHNIASGEDVGAFLLALMVPLLMIIMIAVGCFYPAVDATAGERERSTWETLMTVGASRSSVLVAKYLYVATCGVVAGLLNLFAMTLSMRALLAPLLGDASKEISFSIPWRALPLMILACLALALFIAAGMMLFAVFARTFKEGQAMIGPAYLLALLPPLLVTSPDLELTLGWALVPVANVTLLFRQAMTGGLQWGLTLVVFAVQATMIGLLLLLARWVLSFEDVVVGSYSGSLGRLLKERLRSQASST